MRTGGKAAAFGAFEEDGTYDAGRLENYFGPPTSSRRSGYVCVKRWRRLGLTVRTVIYGSTGDPCDGGTFSEAILTGRMWRTASGVHAGSSTTSVRQRSNGRCVSHLCGRYHGFILGTHRIDCAPGRFPNVVAEPKGRRIRRLIVLTHGCE